MNLLLLPSRTARRVAGRCVVALLAAGAIVGTLSARAEAVESGPSYSVAMTIDAGGEQWAPRVLTKAGEKFAVASGEWRLEMTVRQAKASGDVLLAGKLFKGSDVVSTPTLLVQLNEKATIKVGDSDKRFTLSMIVSPQP